VSQDNPLNKKLKIPADQIRELIIPIGACFASDRILVDGAKVGYMYREPADFDVDSGWRFLAGDETEEYLETPEHHGIYDVNVIANYDEEIIPLLDSPEYSEYERDPKTGEFEEVEGDDEE